MAQKSTIPNSTVPEGGFNDPEQLKNWLNSLSEEQTVIFARIIASRAAQRVLPNISKLIELESDKTKGRLDFILTTLRCNTVSRVAALFATREIDDNLRDAAFFAGSAASSVASATDSAAFSTYSAALSAAAATRSAYSADDSAISAYSAANSAIGSAARSASSAVWAAVTADARALEAGATPEEMAACPLWPEESPYKPQFDRKTFLAAAPTFEVWLDWYEPIVEGKAPWGLPRDIANKLETRIALGDGRGEGGKDFWERDTVEVNAEIKGWVEAARAEVAAAWMHQPVEIEVEVQTVGALQFDGAVNEPIGLKALIAGQDWAIDEASHERHREARRLSDRVLNLCNGKHAGNNALAEFKEDFELFHTALGETLEELNPNLVIPRGDSIRKALEAYANLEDLSKLDPLPDDVLLRANQAIAAYNQFVALDAKLALRDEALFGPDAKKLLIAPGEGQAKIANAVQAGVAKPEVLEATAAEAKAAPPIPDPENRMSRRYSEGQKNFDRIIIAKAWAYAKAHPYKTTAVVSVAITSGGYKSAQFVWNNQDKLLGWFADNQTMTNVLGHLLKFLSKLPLA
jgi:hypothetical protein